MKYRLVYTRRAIKDIHKLDLKVKDRIGKSLLRHEKNPLINAKMMIDPKLGTYRMRVGDYRIIFDLEGSDIVILRVGHRKDIYKKK